MLRLRRLKLEDRLGKRRRVSAWVASDFSHGLGGFVGVWLWDLEFGFQWEEKCCIEKLEVRLNASIYIYV
jgi:hypothetical protein